MLVRLPFPHAYLWPNKRPKSRYAYAKEARKAHAWGWGSALDAGAQTFDPGAAPIPVHVKFYPKPKGPHPDRDNIVASLKHMLDGIAAALGIDDRNFAAPTIEIGPRASRVEIIIGRIEP